MNDEIKEILDRIETASEIFDCLLKPEECIELLDYITNLQQENERLKEENNNKAMNDYAHAIDESWYRELYDDYKSRCEKAIEYINDMLYPIGSCVNGSDLPYESIESLLNILQNGSDEE